MPMKEKVYLQITSGRGPAECCRVVALVLERIVRQAQENWSNHNHLQRGNPVKVIQESLI